MARTLNIKFTAALLAIAIALGAPLTAAAQEAPAAAAKPADPEREKLKKEYTDMRKQEYLRMVQEREKYYRAMADEMKGIYKACNGEDKDACKKAKAHAKTVREEYKEGREKDIKRFKTKVDDYRTKLGDTPTDVEKEHQELKAKKAQ